MERTILAALVSNVTILLVMCVVGDLANFLSSKRHRMAPVISGLVLSGLCITAMNVPLPLPLGMVADIRSVLISVTALVYGPVPTLIVVVAAAAYSLSVGGAGVTLGLTVIFTSALIGLAWGHRGYSRADKYPLASILAMSLTVQAVALACTLLIPNLQSPAVFSAIALPMMLAFPTATVLLCLLLNHAQTRRAMVEKRTRIDAHDAKTSRCNPPLLEQMPDAFALYEIICDARGKSEGYRYLSVNAAFEKMVSLPRALILSKIPQAVLPDMEPAWTETYAKVALTEESARFEFYAGSTGQKYEVTAYLTAPKQCACIFTNITERVHSQEDTQKILLRLQSLINNSPSPIVIMDDKGKIMELSTAARRILGLQPDDRVDRDAARVAPPEIFQKVLYVLSQSTESIPLLESIDVFEYDGSKRYFESRLFPIHSSGQEEKLFGYLAIDVTQRIEVEQALKANKQRYGEYIENAPYAVFVVDEQGKCLEANRAAVTITGYPMERLLRMSVREITAPESAETSVHKMKELIASGHMSAELGYVHEGGLTRWWAVDAVKLSDSYYLCFTNDITDKKQAEAELLHLSYHDYLTGLFNRRFFEAELQHVDIASQLPLSVFVGDINGVKLVNDTFGHTEGDRLIVDCAKIISKCCRNGDTVARIGGDEFGILMPKTDGATALDTLSKIQAALSAFDAAANSDKYAHSVSLGFGIKRSEEEDVLQIFHIAEGYMYQRKLLEHNSSHSTIISSIKATMRAKNHETEEHTERLVGLAIMVAKALKLPQADQDRLELLATLHDIGKVGVSDNILIKPGKLSTEEWVEMKRHPEIGYRIAIATPELIPVAESILCHHERWDGSGYPQGLIGEKIPLLARILAIVDAYDAMTHDRPYRKAISPEAAIAEITLNAGTQFDPHIVEVIMDQKLAFTSNAVLTPPAMHP